MFFVGVGLVFVSVCWLERLNHQNLNEGLVVDVIVHVDIVVGWRVM